MDMQRRAPPFAARWKTMHNVSSAMHGSAGLQALIAGDSQAAEDAARTATSWSLRDTPRRDALFAEAAVAEAQADFPGAEAAYREIAALHPDAASGLVELADYLKRQNKNEQAIEAYHGALRLDPAIARVHVDLCQLYSRVDNYPLSEQHAQEALKKFRAMGNLGGEAQALLCFGDELAQQGSRLTEARNHIEAARALFVKTGQAYGSPRVYQYLGYLAGREHNYPAAAEAFSEAVSRSRQLGNRQLEGLALMNLAYAHHSMGKISEAVGYYEQSRRVYEAVGDQRRAAEQDVNAAGLAVTAGGNVDSALRRLMNARAVLHKLGYVDFEVTAMLGQGEAELAAGRVAESVRVLREGSSLATERQLTNRLAELKTMIAAAEIVQGNYEPARQALEPLAASADVTPETRIVLARVYVRLGDFSGARQQLERASADVRRTGEAGINALIDRALGELRTSSERPRRRLRLIDESSPPAQAISRATWSAKQVAGRGRLTTRAVQRSESGVCLPSSQRFDIRTQSAWLLRSAASTSPVLP